jgi:hypothetical protein
MEIGGLLDLPALPVRITARAIVPIHLPSNGASSLRGAFGMALKRLVCVHTERKECAGCPVEERCAYPYLFETRAAAGEAGTRGFEDLPRPYVIRSGLGEQFVLPGDTLTWSVTLIGRAIEHLPYFALAWQEMGQRGIGSERGRFQLLQVEALDLDGRAGETLYDRATNRLRRPAGVIGAAQLWDWQESFLRRSTCGAREAELRFVTPTLLKYQGHAAAEPEFHVLWRSLQRRLSTLRLAHGTGRCEADFAAAIRHAETIRLERWTARELSWSRYSRRQEQRVPMRGFVGVARYRGDLAPLLPALKLGTLVGVGDNSTFGQGHYEISPADFPDGQ